MRLITVFYAWQSDTQQRFNRHLIRLALEVVARRINLDAALGIEVRIDSDTQGVPGQPPVTETILKKIEACDIFAPDLTFVAQTDGGKFVPNPNVMVEYGYALRAKSHKAMLPIMNTAFGPPENLPFDMGHLRHPIQYYASPTAKNAERRAARQQLCDRIEEALRVTLATQIDQARKDNPFQEADPIRPPAFFFARGEVLARAGHPGEQEFQFLFGQAVYLRLFPANGDQPPVTLAKLVQVFEARKLLPMSMANSGIVGRNTHGPIIHEPIGKSQLWGLTQAFETGELWGINGQVFTAHANTLRPAQAPEAITVIPMVTLEKLYSKVLRRYVQVAASEFNFRSPYTVEMGAVGLNGVFLAFPTGGPFGNGSIKGPIMKASLKRRYGLSMTSESAIDAVLTSYFNDFYDLVAVSRADALTDQVTAAHGLLPR